MVKTNHRYRENKSVFYRVKEAMKSGSPFVPTPIAIAESGRKKEAGQPNAIYASTADFAAFSGLSLEAVEMMLQSGALTHISVRRDGNMIHVTKGLRDLESMEQGGVAKRGGPHQKRETSE